MMREALPFVVAAAVMFAVWMLASALAPTAQLLAAGLVASVPLALVAGVATARLVWKD